MKILKHLSCIFLLFSFCAIQVKAQTKEESPIFDVDSTELYQFASFNTYTDTWKADSGNVRFERLFSEKFKDDFDPKMQYELLKESNVDMWELKLFTQRNQQISFLKEHEKEITEDFNSLVKNQINFNYWHYLLAYAVNRSNENTKSTTLTSLPKIMTEALTPAKINKSEYLSAKSFRAFLPYFVIYYNSQSHQFLKYADGLKSLTDKGTYAQENLSAEILDLALAQMIEQNALRITPSLFSYWNSQITDIKLQKYLTDTFYDGIIQREIKKREEELAQAKQQEQKKADEYGLMDLQDKPASINDYKGKVIYVDFWASWCGPCRQELPYSKKLHEQLTPKQQKEIVFLYISIDKELDKWKDAVEKLKLTEQGENLHSFEVSRILKIPSIPRYMIINKEGKIVDNDTTRPSNPETLSKLLEFVK